MQPIVEKNANSGAVGEAHTAPVASMEKILFRWPGQQEDTLDIPSFSLSACEHVFISGPSGSGKSTLLGLMAGILIPQSGSITVNGVRLNELGTMQRDIFRGDYIGYIFQQFNLIPYLSILENVLIPCQFSPVRYNRVCQQVGSPIAGAKMLLERLDLSASLWSRSVKKLSIGQQQRVAAARALIGQPRVLIADEPTSSLDTDRRKAFLSLLLEECREAGTSLLFVSHDQNLAENFSRVVHLPELNQAVGEVER